MNIDDSAASALAETATLPTNSTVVSKPVDYAGVDTDTFPSPAPAGPYGTPAPRGTSSLGDALDGTNPNGTWSLYVVTDGAGDGAGEINGGWSLTITTGSEALTSTTLLSNLDPSFTSAPDQAVSFAAGVTSGTPATPVTSGTVDFTSDGTTISGCGAVALDGSGEAVCSTAFSTEADLTIEALYSGTASFAVSTSSILQAVDNHTTVVAANDFANPGAITLNNPTSPTPTAEPASPYPSRIYVSNLGPVTGLTVTLKDITYPFSQDLDILLVGPQGQSIVLLSNVGPSTGTHNASNVTLTFSDAAASRIPQTTALGSPGSSVTTKPVDYPGTDTDTFPTPAPSGPYGQPAPNGSATLGGTFDGTNPNGAWSLYVVTVGEGDGTGSIAGDWSLDFAVAAQTISFQSTAPSPGIAGTTYTASATATSGLPISYSIDSSSTSGTCSVTSTGLVSFLAAGTCVLDANQSGDGNWSAAPQVQQTINVESAAGAPTGLAATPGDAQVVLNWTAPASNGSPITSYNVYEGTSSGGETFLQSTGSAAATFTATGLTNGTKYYFEVTAVNGVGEGPVSNEASATPATLPGAPTALAATAGNAQVALAWSAPPSTGGDPITGYNIYRGTSSGSETFLTSTNTTATTYRSTGLTNGTTYYFEVTAVTLAGEGSLSNEASATPATLPGAPTALTATASDSEVDLSWTAPTNNGGEPVTSYNIYQGTSSGGETLLQNTGTSATTFTSTGLTNGTTYYFKVTAVSGAGEGPVSNEVSAMPAVVPGAPMDLTATAGNAQVALAWSAPASSGGDAITGYNIYQGTSSGGETLLTSTSTTVTAFISTGLTNGTTNYFKVTAVTSAGEGPASNEASATPAALPGAPTGLSATSGDAQVVLNWTAPASNGSPITSYNVYEGTSPGGETFLQSTGSAAATFTATGLTNGTKYFFKVTAVNGVGEGPVSNEASATPATVPDAPSGLFAVAGNTQVVLNWDAPSNGGSAITSYNIYEGTSPGGETFLQGTGSTATTFTLTGLTNGTTYYFQVTAVNGVGEGPAFNQVSATPATLPGAPTGLSATSSDTQVVLNWTAPASNGGSAITSYNIYEGTSSGGETFLESTGSGAPTFTVTGLTNGTKYFFKVTAVNGVGEGPISSEASATPATVASGPTGFSATAGNAQVSLNWTAPASNGGSAITSYNIYKGTSSGGETFLESTGSTGTTFTVTGLTNGTKYYFQVTAVNGVGEGPAFNQASATPATLPGPPTGPFAAAGSSEVFISWGVPATDGGSSVTSYNIYEGTSSGAESLLTSTTNTSYTATGLVNGTKYYFEVTAINGVGEGPFSAEVSATPATPPPSSPATTSTTTATTTTAPPPSQGYLMVGKGGKVYSFGSAVSYGSVKSHVNNVVALALTADRGGYWVVVADGRVFAFGDAHNYSSVHGANQHVGRVVGISPTANGRGYWLVDSDGQVATFGNAHNYGSIHSARKNVDQIVAIAATADGRGYWLAGSDGTVYAFGDAHNFGSLSSRKIKANDVVGITTAVKGTGYWMIGSDGRVFAFGSAHNFGSPTAGGKGALSTIGMARTPDGQGYWTVRANGAVSGFGDADPEGSLAGQGVSANSIVGVSA